MSWLWNIEHDKLSPISSRRCSMCTSRLKDVCVDVHTSCVRAIMDEIGEEEEEGEEEEDKEEKKRREISLLL